MYLVTLDAEIRRASNGSCSLDNVVLESFAIDIFLGLVSEDQQAVSEYREIASGKRLQIPTTDCMASAALTLRRVDMPSSELGFKQSPDGIITNIIHRSRAAEAGLRVGSA